MKTSTTHSKHSAIITNTNEPYSLTKAQAVRSLDRKFIEYLTLNAAPHLANKAPDFRTLIDENIRTQDTTDSSGNYKRRGNRIKWGQIPHLRQSRGGNFALFFRESDLAEWFNDTYAPIISKTLH
jgi:hypothetical protein